MSLGAVSKAKLAQAHPKLQRLFAEVDRLISKNKRIDLTVVCAHRGEAEQNQALRDGNSTKAWPDSKHNKLPSEAVDVAPYPIDWHDKERFFLLAGYVMAVADSLDIEVEVGALWKRFVDLPHVELTARELNRP